MHVCVHARVVKQAALHNNEKHKLRRKSRNAAVGASVWAVLLSSWPTGPRYQGGDGRHSVLNAASKHVHAAAYTGNNQCQNLDFFSQKLTNNGCIRVGLVIAHTRLHFIFVVDISALRSLFGAAIFVGREINIFISQYIK